MSPDTPDTRNRNLIKMHSTAFVENPPTATWPNRVADNPLPDHIERALQEGFAVVQREREQAAALAEQAVSDARACTDPGVLPRALYLAATLMRQAWHPHRAIVLCLEAQPLLERRDDRWRASRVVLLRGGCFLDVGEHERALELITEAAERFKGLRDRAQVGRCHTQMAKAHQMAGRLQTAVEHACQALALLAPTQEQAALRRHLMNNEARWRVALGEQWAHKGESAQAQAEFQRAAQALPRLDELDPADPRALGYLATAVCVHIANRDGPQAGPAMQRLMAVARCSRDPFERGLAWLRLADFRGLQGARARAIGCARRAATCLEGLPHEPSRVTVQLLLSSLLEEAGDPKGACEAHSRAMDIEAVQQKQATTLRAELLMLDMAAEQETRMTAQTLEYAQRLSNVGHMVASVNHELNQPLASIRMLAEITQELLATGQQEEAQANLEVMQKLSTRLVDLTSKLATIPAPRNLENPLVNIQHAVDEAMVALHSRLAQTPCEVVRRLPDVAVRAAEGPLVRVVVNLLNNALDAMEACPHPQVLIEAHTDQDKLHLTLTDNGPGISDNVLERVFQPFFSTKAAGLGLGLGLALSRDAVRKMDGDLTAGNSPGGGAVFCISLPLALA